MISTALDRYNRNRPYDEKVKTITDLAMNVLSLMDKEITLSSITSTKQTFRRINRVEQDTVSIPMLIALSQIFIVDYNTLLGYWIDNLKNKKT